MALLVPKSLSQAGSFHGGASPTSITDGQIRACAVLLQKLDLLSSF